MNLRLIQINLTNKQITLFNYHSLVMDNLNNEVGSSGEEKNSRLGMGISGDWSQLCLQPGI